MRDKPAVFIGRLMLLILAAVILISSCLEFYSVASGTGNWWADFSFKWALFFIAFDLFCLLILAILILALWFPPTLTRLARPAIDLRNRLGMLRWLAIALILILPIWLFQYSLWGIVFHGPVRLVVWGMAAVSTGFLLTRVKDCVADLSGGLQGVFLSGLAFILAIPFSNVTDYPFSLGWSEGNRLWDYSILFGRSRYIYPPDKDLTPFLDLSRQIVGGIPFLLPGLTIWQERFWLGLTNLLPYAFLGLLVFGLWREGRRAGWILAALWGLAFLRQGPIHTPLLICAMLTWLMWRRPLWLAFPVIAATAYLASVSRFTWTFAPAIWIGMLELAGADTLHGRLSRLAWRRAIMLGFAGLLGGYLLPALWRFISNAAGGGLSAETVIQSVTRQPLLWYRLLPNSTYSLGVLLGLLLAVCPLGILLIYLVHKKMWALNGWQKAAILLPLLAFLAVGLVVSTKIGGGGDLHNLDMFLIGLLFAAGVAWAKFNPQWTGNGHGVPAWMRLSLFLLVALPAFNALFSMQPLLYARDVSRLQALTGIEDPRLIGLLPAREEIESSLDRIRAVVAEAQARGEVLFMDQRQLLTFGYIQGVPLVAEYEKKHLMDQAMGNAAASVFDQFYRDLAAHRFALIVSEPLHTPIQNEEYGFGEENNAWVKWVSRPLLCYYQAEVTLRDLRVQLLVPKTEEVDCTDAIPPEVVFRP